MIMDSHLKIDDSTCVWRKKASNIILDTDHATVQYLQFYKHLHYLS